MIELFNCPGTRGIRVSWLLEELGAEYDFKLVRLGKKDTAAFREYLDVNPAGKVPAIRDGDLALTESAAIMTYLGDKFPQRGLVPAAGTPERGKYEQWCYFVMAELEQPLWTLAKHRFALPPERRIPAISETAEWEFQKALRILDAGLGDKAFILGEDFSAADILVGQTLNWGRLAKQPLEPDNLKRYAERVLAHPALQQARDREDTYRDS